MQGQEIVDGGRLIYPTRNGEVKATMTDVREFVRESPARKDDLLPTALTVVDCASGIDLRSTHCSYEGEIEGS